jgi:hypothetical protein
VEEALRAGGAWAQIEEKSGGEVRWRAVRLSLYIGAAGEAAADD